MFLYDNWILNPNIAPNWFTNVKVIEITPYPGVSGTVPLKPIRYASASLDRIVADKSHRIIVA